MRWKSEIRSGAGAARCRPGLVSVVSGMTSPDAHGSGVTPPAAPVASDAIPSLSRSTYCARTVASRRNLLPPEEASGEKPEHQGIGNQNQQWLSWWELPHP